MRVIAAIPACGLLFGCGLGVWRPDIPLAVPVVVLLLSLIVSCVALVRVQTALLAAAVALGAAAAGVLLAERAWREVWRSPLRLVFESIAGNERRAAIADGMAVPMDDRASVVVVGVLREDASLGDSGTVSLRVSVQWVGRASSARDPAVNPVTGDVLLSVAGVLSVDRMPEWRRGRAIRAFAQLRRPTRYLDPGVPDQERALARQGVVLVGSVKSGALVDVVSRGSRIDEAAASMRAFARRALMTAVGRWSPRAAAIVTAIVIGDRTGLDAGVERRLQEAGTYHVIAISGGNIAILAGLALVAFRFAGFLGRWAMVTAIAGLLAYSAIVAGGASVDRATLMAVVYLSGRALDLRGPPMNAVALVAGLLVAARPLSIAGPGFLLTFGASAAIIAVSEAKLARAPVKRGPTPSHQRALGAIWELSLASLAAEAALLPIAAVFFERVTLAGLLLNFVAIPAMSVAQIAGMAVIPLIAISDAAAAWCGALASLGAEALVRTSTLVDVAPFLTWRVPAPSGFAVFTYYVALVVWWTLRDRAARSGPANATETQRRKEGTSILCVPVALRPEARSRAHGDKASAWLCPVAKTVALASAAWMLVAPWTWWVSRGDGRLHVTFLDVGQGDAALIRFPRGHTMLVDAGGSPGSSTFDVGDRVVGPALRSFGIRRLDTVVVTHGDADHVGGAAAVVDDFRPHDVWEGIPVPPSVETRRLYEHAVAAGVAWRRVRDGDDVFVDDVRVVVKHPEPADWERQKVRNDDSIVLELRWKDVSFVLTGDIGREPEQRIAPLFEPAATRVLKVPHHGSLTSSSAEFLGALRPTIAVVSAGRNNTFGHPAPPVLERYQAVGARVYRTDRDGAVSIDTDGHMLNVCRLNKGNHEDTKARR